MYDCRHDVHPNRCSRHRYKLVSLYVYTTKIHFYVVNDRQIMQQCNKLSPENVVHFISFRFEKIKNGQNCTVATQLYCG